MCSRIKEDVHKLFEFWCELIQSPDSTGSPGTIVECFPRSSHDNLEISKIPDFVYPCEFEDTSVQLFSFVWTSDDSNFRFGFCRHDPKAKSAMVLITHHPWHDTFLKFLAVLSELKRHNNGEFELFLTEAYNKGVPNRGCSLKLYYNSGQNHFTFQRPSQFELPSIPANIIYHYDDSSQLHSSELVYKLLYRSWFRDYKPTALFGSQVYIFAGNALDI